MTTVIDPDIWGNAPKKQVPTSGQKPGRRRILIVLLGLAVGLPLVGLSLATLFGRVDPPKHKSVVQIALVALPPPPPPKPQEEPPKPKEEVKIDQPKPTPDDPKPMPQVPPPGPMGVDAQGTGPGDSFGLAGRPGGRDIIASSGGGGGLGLSLFGSSTARHIAQELARDPRLKNTNYKVEIRVWLSKDGRFEREEIVRGSGDSEIDKLIREGLSQLGALQTPVPQNVPQPLRIRVMSTDA